VVKTVKVPEDQFKAVIRALLTATPMPASTITTERSRKTSAKKRTAKRRK
jgi:hypothetical protein